MVENASPKKRCRSSDILTLHPNRFSEQIKMCHQVRTVIVKGTILEGHLGYIHAFRVRCSQTIKEDKPFPSLSHLPEQNATARLLTTFE